MGLPQSVNLYLQKYASKAGTSREEQGLEASVNHRLACGHLENLLDNFSGDYPNSAEYRWILHKRRNGTLLEGY